MDIEILYQDQHLVAINKEAGLISCSGGEPESDGLSAMKRLRDQLGERVWPLHRLDRPTSGVLLFALNSNIARCLREQFDSRQIKKSYTAVAIGETAKEWTCEAPLQKNEEKPILPCQTHFSRERIIKLKGETFSILLAKPVTGRFHQIRKHLSMEGFPIVGDFLYGEVDQMVEIGELINQPRMMLHAETLSFVHPTNNEGVVVRAPLPNRFSVFTGSI